MKKTWDIVVPVRGASGKQFFTVTAETLEQAKQEWEAGRASFEGDDISIDEIGEPKFTEQAE
jgi:hypothetical protein